jgi:hypothetical protein
MRSSLLVECLELVLFRDIVVSYLSSKVTY